MSYSKNNETIDSFSILSVDTTIALFANYVKPDCHLSLNFEVPTKASSKLSLRAAKTMIVSLLQPEEENENISDIDEIIRRYTKSYIFNYLEEGNDAILNFGDDVFTNSNWMTYEEICEGKVLYNADGIFSYSVKTYSFTGGAHGNSTNHVASLDLSTNSVITLETLCGQAKREELKSEVYSRLNPKHQLLTDEIDLTENFYLDDRGVTFVYDPLDIAAYSEGEIEVFVEWDKIR